MSNTAFFCRHGLSVQGQLLVNTAQLTFGANIVISNNTLRVGMGAVSNVVVNSTSFFMGNTTANVNLIPTQLKIANASGSANLEPTQLVIGSSVITSGIVAVGANLQLTAVALSVGNTIANLVANSIIVQVANASGTTSLQSNQILVGANVSLTTTKLAMGSATVNSVANSILLKIQDTVNTTNVTSDGLKVANVTTGLSVVNSAGFFGNGAGLTSVVPGSAGSTTHVQFNDAGFTNGVSGFTFSKSTNNVVVANNITAATYDTSSDRNLKDLLYEVNETSVLHLPVWSYTLKSDPIHRKIGLIAQEVQNWYPEAVTRGENGFLAINFDMITSAMIVCMKQMNKRIEELELELGN